MDARHRPLTLIALAGLGSCSSASYVASADEEVDRVLGIASEETLGNRREWIIQPKIEEPAPAKPEAKEEVKQDAKGEAKEEAKGEIKEEVKPEARPETQPATKPETRPEAKQEPA